MTSPRRFRHLSKVSTSAGAVPVASSWRSRLLGLALLPRELAGAGLLLPRCRAVHTVGMRFALDIFFLDAGGAVLRTARGAPPFRFLRHPGASAVLEVPAETSRERG